MMEYLVTPPISGDSGFIPAPNVIRREVRYCGADPTSAGTVVFIEDQMREMYQEGRMWGWQNVMWQRTEKDNGCVLELSPQPLPMLPVNSTIAEIA